MAESFSFSTNAWKRLKKNKGAMIGLILICLSVIIAVFAYFISTDSTPNADRQIVEIQARKPGFTQLFLKIKKKRKFHQPGFSTGFFSVQKINIFLFQSIISGKAKIQLLLKNILMKAWKKDRLIQKHFCLKKLYRFKNILVRY